LEQVDSIKEIELKFAQISLAYSAKAKGPASKKTLNNFFKQRLYPLAQNLIKKKKKQAREEELKAKLSLKQYKNEKS
jgi:hypothetical protein